MLRAGVLALLLAGTLTSAEETAVQLDVKPLLCIIDSRTPACDMDFMIAWQSTVQGYYCLFNHFVTSPLRCWEETGAGRHSDRRLVNESFQFWLTAGDSAQPLAAVTVEVMTTETNDRRRKRRTRHIWDIW